MTTADWVIIAVGFLVIGTLFNRIRSLEATVAKQTEYLGRLEDYAKEIDPRFDEERRVLAELNEAVTDGKSTMAGINHRDLERRKRERGERMLHDPI
jgi:hypothetical protein